MIQTAQRLPYSNSCVQNILRLRAEIPPRKIRLEQDRLDHERLMSQFPDFNQEREAARQREIVRLGREVRRQEDEIARLESLLKTMEEECKESEAQAPEFEDRAGLEHSLRKSIDDPRHWRDGDPVLASLVTDGFKRLYPDESEG